MIMNIRQYRLANNKTYINDMDYWKSSYQRNILNLSDEQMETMVTLVFNTTDRNIGQIHLKNLVNQFQKEITKQIKARDKKPFKIGNDILPCICSGEHRKSDGSFHVHMVFKQWTNDSEFNVKFNKELNNFLLKSERMNMTSNWSLLMQLRKKVIITLKDLELTSKIYKPSLFNFNLNRIEGKFTGSPVIIKDYDVKTLSEDNNRKHPPILDYILKDDNDLIHISRSMLKKIKNNNLWINGILSGKKKITESVYLSSIIRFIPDEILELDLKERNMDFLTNLNKTVVKHNKHQEKGICI